MRPIHLQIPLLIRPLLIIRLTPSSMVYKHTTYIQHYSILLSRIMTATRIGPSGDSRSLSFPGRTTIHFHGYEEAVNSVPPRVLCSLLASFHRGRASFTNTVVHDRLGNNWQVQHSPTGSPTRPLFSQTCQLQPLQWSMHQCNRPADAATSQITHLHEADPCQHPWRLAAAVKLAEAWSWLPTSGCWI